MDGCSGGLPSAAFEYLSKNGSMLESDYPFTGKDETCKYNKSDQMVKVIRYENVPKNNITQFHTAIAKGPVSVGV